MCSVQKNQCQCGVFGALRHHSADEAGNWTITRHGAMTTELPQDITGGLTSSEQTANQKTQLQILKQQLAELDNAVCEEVRPCVTFHPLVFFS